MLKNKNMTAQEEWEKKDPSENDSFSPKNVNNDFLK